MSRQAFSMAAMAWDVSPPAVDRERVERGVDAGDRAGALAEERGAEAVDQRRHAYAAALVGLGPARDALIAGHAQERSGLPASLGVAPLALPELHPLRRSCCLLA